MSKAFYRLVEPLIKLDLRFKVTLVFVLPIFIVVVYLSYDHYRIENELMMEQAKLTATQLGDVVLGSLNHSMQLNDRVMLSSAIKDIGSQGNIRRVWIINLDGEVRESSNPTELGQNLEVNTMGCVECHQLPSGERPQLLSTLESNGLLRIAVPIANNTECQKCHSSLQKHLGMLIVDISVARAQSHLRNDLRSNLVWSFIIAGVGMIGGLVLVTWLIIRRVEVLHDTMDAFEKGDHSTRIKKIWHTEDELTRLTHSFNKMADSIVRHEDEQRGLAEMRQQAIIDERERIARELHDGVAQFIGYVNTKIVAVRLLIKQARLEEADQNLGQVEQAVHEQSNDIRASIIGLKLASEGGKGLTLDLREYIAQVERLSDFPIILEIAPEAEDFELDKEKELHLLRIVQEAMSNIRKHASARQARVTLERQADELVLSIQDDGVGFNPWQWSSDAQSHFGLQTMQERAGMIGAALKVESQPGQGTLVTVRLNVKES